MRIFILIGLFFCESIPECKFNLFTAIASAMPNLVCLLGATGDCGVEF